MAFTPEIDDLVTQYHASHCMVDEYARLAAQDKITPVERECLESEKLVLSRFRSRLSDKISEALVQGTGVFDGRKKDSSSFGNSLSVIFKGFFEYAVPELFPKFEMGAVKLKGDEAAKILKAENLNGLPTVFYEGEDSLGLVIREGQNNVLNPNAPIALEIFGQIHQAKEYGGERETGKKLEQHFSGFGYGWDTDVLKVVLAALLPGRGDRSSPRGESTGTTLIPRPGCLSPTISGSVMRGSLSVSASRFSRLLCGRRTCTGILRSGDRY